MDFGSSQLYTIELWSSNGHPLADISALAQNRTYTLERNEAELLTFDLDYYAFESYAASINADPHTLLNPYTTDVKVKRAGVYLFAAQVVSVLFDLAADFSRANESGGGGAQTTLDQRLQVSCTGYLNLFKDRYVTNTYTQQESTFIAGDLLTQTQAQTNGSVGVTLAASQYATGVLRDRTYARDNVKTKLQELTALIDGRFDFGFDTNKVFYTWAQAGSNRTDIKFTFGGPTGNIIGLYMDRNATTLYNQVIGIGSGLGPDQLVSIQNNTISQINYYLRQDIKQYSSVTLQPTLDQNASTDLALESALLEIPQITITGKELVGNNFLNIGDRIPLVMNSHPFLANLNGIYRIEKMIVKIDENDFESEIQLYFDNFAVNPGT